MEARAANSSGRSKAGGAPISGLIAHELAAAVVRLCLALQLLGCPGTQAERAPDTRDTPSQKAIEVEDKASQDRDGPTLRSVSISSSTVDTNVEDATVTVTIEATDDQSGVSSIYAAFGRRSCSVTISAEDSSATHSCDLRFSADDEPGVRSLDLFLEDRAGNSSTWSSKELKTAGLPHELEVKDSPKLMQAPEHRVAGGATRVSVPLTGTGEDMKVQEVPSQRMVIIDLPHAQARLPHKVFKFKRGLIRSAGVRAAGSGIQVKVRFAPAAGEFNFEVHAHPSDNAAQVRQRHMMIEVHRR